MEISDADSIIVHGKCALYIPDKDVGNAEKISQQLSSINLNVVQFLESKDWYCSNPIRTNQFILNFVRYLFTDDRLRSQFNLKESFYHFLGHFSQYFKNEAIMSVANRKMNIFTNPEPFEINISFQLESFQGHYRFLIGINIIPGLHVKINRSPPEWRVNLLKYEDINLIRNPSIMLFNEIASSIHADVVEQPRLKQDDELTIHIPVENIKCLNEFKQNNSSVKKVAFIIMGFGKSNTHDLIVTTIKSVLEKNGLKGVRADDHEYTPEKLANIRTYIYGCDFGIAVFDNIDAEYFNPNVSLEVGSLLALNKPVCLLKDKGLETVPSDIVGRLYREFDSQNCEETITSALTNWLKEYKFII